jgi:hypothetical protein
MFTMTLRTINPKSLGHDEVFHRKVYRLLLGLLQACDVLPSSLLTSGIKPPEDDPVFYGSFADIFKTSKDGQEVALKRPRVYIGHDYAKVQQVL